MACRRMDVDKFLIYLARGSLFSLREKCEFVLTPKAFGECRNHSPGLFYNMRYKNLSPEPIVENFKGQVYVEEWRPVLGYEKYYKISSFGRVQSLRDNVVMCQQKNDRKYLYVGLKGDNYKRKFRVHRLVATAFIDNPFYKPEVNHDDFNKTNNFYMNLCWMTGKENTYHAYLGGKRKVAGLKKEKVGEHPIKCQKVINSETGKVYDSVFQLCDEIGCMPKEIRRKLSGERVNNTPYRWLKGQWTMFYKKRHQRDMERFLELRSKIYGVAI